jgi:hypothetical protein
LVLPYFRIFKKVNGKMRRSKRLSVTSRKRSCLVLQKMIEECCVTKEGSVCLTIRN